MTIPAYLTNVAAFLPGAPVSNDEIELRLGTVGDKPSRARAIVLRSNGIKWRHYAVDPVTGAATHTSAQLAAEAVRRLGRNNTPLGGIDCLAGGTSLPDQLMPNHGVMIHGELGLPPCEVAATSGVCLAGLSALKYAVMGVKCGDFRRAVAVASERASAMMRGKFFDHDVDISADEFEKRPTLAFEKDFLRFMLSDGAGAVLIEPTPAASGLSLRVEWIFERSYANETPVCMYAGAERREDGSLKGWMEFDPPEWLSRSILAVRQDAKLLNEKGIYYTIERGLTEVRAERGLDPDSVTWFLPHYSSEYFRNRVLDGMQRVGFVIPQERWFTNLTSKGNTGSASMYIMLEELYASGKLKRGDRLLCFVPESGRFATGFVLLTVCDAASP